MGPNVRRTGARTTRTTAISTVEAISAALAINGEPLNSATAIVTPAAVENYFNIYVSTIVEVPRNCCLTVAMENTSTQAVSFAYSNMAVDRIS